MYNQIFFTSYVVHLKLYEKVKARIAFHDIKISSSNSALQPNLDLTEKILWFEGIFRFRYFT